MPVGRIEYAYLYPLTFFEFLEASEEKELRQFLNQVTWQSAIPKGIHQQAKKTFLSIRILGRNAGNYFPLHPRSFPGRD